MYLGLALCTIGVSVLAAFKITNRIITFNRYSPRSSLQSSSSSSSSQSTIPSLVKKAPYEDVIPFLSEHINFSDQILFLGCKTDMALQLARNEYGIRKTGFMLVIDSDEAAVSACKETAENDAILAEYVTNGKLRFACVDYSNMPEICKQSCVDAIVDYGGIDSVLSSGSVDNASKCVQQLQNALRLGNILVALSVLEDEQFKIPFEKIYGWVQELDGDPGELSAWYRGKSNIAASKSNFNQLGLKMFVYTNTDNC